MTKKHDFGSLIYSWKSTNELNKIQIIELKK